jgi:hypothetical protein
MSIIRRLSGMLLVWLVFNACSSSIAVFDQYAYRQTTALKVDALDLMDKAGVEYTAQEKQIMDMDILFRKVMEYERHRPQNEIVSDMWFKLYDPAFNLYGGFMKRWKEKGKLDRSFISDQQQIVGLAFDQIAELESKLNKRK